MLVEGPVAQILYNTKFGPLPHLNKIPNMKPIHQILALFIATALHGQMVVQDELIHLVELGESIMYSEQSEQRDSANQAFFTLLQEVIEDAEDPFQIDFSDVKNLSVLDSDDGSLRMFTWLVPGFPGTEVFNGLFILREKKDHFKVVVLEDFADSLIDPEYRPLTPGQWYGALYYQLHTVKDKNNTYHMLMGYRPIDEKVQQKLIDVIHIDDKGLLRFGAKIFETPKLMDRVYQRPPYRLFFNYSFQAAATFRYRKEEGMIVLDHLSPPDDKPKGMWAYYGPDFSYDGLEFVKGRWVLREDIKVESKLKQPLPSKAPKKDPQTGKVRKQ